MRIALVCDYSFDLLGGAQRAVLNEAAALDGAGHRVLLVAPRPARRPVATSIGTRWTGARSSGTGWTEALWTDARRLPIVDFTVVADSPELRRTLRDRFVRDGIEVVHVHSEFGHARASIAVARALGLRVVHTIHTAYWPGLPAGVRFVADRGLTAIGAASEVRTGNALLDRTITTARLADVVISPSAHQAADLRMLGLDPVVQPNCWHGAAVTTPLPAGRALHVAWIGRCVPEKRLGVFARAVAEAQRRRGPGLLRATIAGSGPTLGLARLAAIGAPDIRFFGRIDPDAVRDLIASSHLTALTSLGFDNQPMTIVESIRGGRGVLVADRRLRDGLDSGAGLYPGTADAHGIADLLVELARDRGRVDAPAVAAVRASALFSPAAHAAALTRLYRGSAALALKRRGARQQDNVA